jgi:hypothetical protein
MILWGMFTKNLQDALSQNCLSDINGIVGKYGSRLVETDIKRQIADLRIDPKLPTSISLELIAISKIEGFSVPKFGSLVEILARILKVEPGMSVNDATARYVTVKAEHQKRIDIDFSYIWENLLVHRSFLWSHMFATASAPFHAYIETVVIFTVIRLLMFGWAAEHGDLSPEKAAEIIQLASKVLEHSPRCLSSIHTFFKDNGLYNLGNCAALLLA